MNFLKIGLVPAFTLALAIGPSAVSKESVQYKNLLAPLLQTEVDTLDQPVVYPPGTPDITAAIVTIPSGGKTGWHSHEVPLFVYILDGEVTIDYGDKGTKVYKKGDSFMEAMNWPHNGVNAGSEPVRIMAVYIGSDEKADTMVVPAPK